MYKHAHTPNARTHTHKMNMADVISALLLVLGLPVLVLVHASTFSTHMFVSRYICIYFNCVCDRILMEGVGNA